MKPRVVPLGQPGLEHLLGAAFDRVQQPARSGTVADRGEVDDDGDELVAAASVPPDVFIYADHLDSVEPVRVGDQHPATLSQHCIIRGVPRNTQAFSDSGHRQVLYDQPGQGPPQGAAGQPSTWLGLG